MTPRSTKPDMNVRILLSVFLIILIVGTIVWIINKRWGQLNDNEPVTKKESIDQFDHGFPIRAEKPKPIAETFRGCPPEGRGGDPVLNVRKNRNDKASSYPVDFYFLKLLPWPAGIERKKRENWTESEAAEVAKFEGIPI